MMIRYRFEVHGKQPLPASRAYALYSSLLSIVPQEVGQSLHLQGETPISQHLYYNKETGQDIWQITLLGQSAVDALSPVLDSLEKLDTNMESVFLRLLERTSITAEALITAVRDTPVPRRVTLFLITPVAFKQSGQYAILPEPKLICQSLISKWNATFSAFPMDDVDAQVMLLQGLRIGDLSIRSTRYPLKGVHIPGILGSVTLDAAMSPPIMEIWNLLVHFSAYSGIGIKTALGMGGIHLKEPMFPAKTPVPIEIES